METGSAPEEIMAEYLLKGGKMLAKACPTCGSPLFECRGETLCPVCREEKKRKGRTGMEKSRDDKPDVQERRAAPGLRGQGETAAELESTIIHICTRIREEPSPDNCLTLMECVLKGVEALLHLTQE